MESSSSASRKPARKSSSTESSDEHPRNTGLEFDLASNLKISDDESPKKSQASTKSKGPLTLDRVCDGIASGTFKKVIVMTGAGISVAAGIPDFRSPKTGLYHNLAKYKIPYPEAIFELDYFKKDPKPFYQLVNELYPYPEGKFVPTPCHHFSKLLDEKGILLRHYTQNIDGLEEIAGVPSERLVMAHGTFRAAQCTDCKKEHEEKWMIERVFHSKKGSVPLCTSCAGYVKPNIVFFGENLPRRFFKLTEEDFPKCDLLIIMGTSLKVHPFAGLVSKVSPTVPRVLLNLENPSASNEGDLMDLLMRSSSTKGFDPAKYPHRDVAVESDVQKTILEIADRLKWRDQLDELIKAGNAKKIEMKESKETCDASKVRSEEANHEDGRAVSSMPKKKDKGCMVS